MGHYTVSEILFHLINFLKFYFTIFQMRNSWRPIWSIQTCLCLQQLDLSQHRSFCLNFEFKHLFNKQEAEINLKFFQFSTQQRRLPIRILRHRSLLNSIVKLLQIPVVVIATV